MINQTNASTDIELNIESKSLRIGSVCGVEKEYPIAVHYHTNNRSNSVTVTGHTNQAYPYKDLVGKTFNSIEALHKTCLAIYTPPYLD